MSILHGHSFCLAIYHPLSHLAFPPSHLPHPLMFSLRLGNTNLIPSNSYPAPCSSGLPNLVSYAAVGITPSNIGSSFVPSPLSLFALAYSLENFELVLTGDPLRFAVGANRWPVGLHSPIHSRTVWSSSSLPRPSPGNL